MKDSLLNMHHFQSLLNAYKNKKKEIKERLKEFEEVWQQRDNERIFEELCYCILTANTSAEMGIRVLRAVKPFLLKDDTNSLSARLHSHSCRFYNMRARFICETRDFLKHKCNLDLVALISSFKTAEERRNFFAKTKEIKGIGYKEASHFLRNIGFKGYAILDKHILNTMCEFNIICEKPKTLTPKRYLMIEEQLKNFSEQIGIDFDELDLLIWSEKTGKILK
ncbi:MAG: N-glycosylase/DNA lyase [bacterium]